MDGEFFIFMQDIVQAYRAGETTFLPSSSPNIHRLRKIVSLANSTINP